MTITVNLDAKDVHRLTEAFKRLFPKRDGDINQSDLAGILYGCAMADLQNDERAAAERTASAENHACAF